MSAHSTSHNSEQDIISICTFCREDGTVLLTIPPDNELAQFPSLRVNTSWRLTLRKLINTISGLSGSEVSIMRITKFWVPDNGPVFHVIYKVKCPLCEKKLLNLQGNEQSNIQWCSLEQIQEMCFLGLLTSPEVPEYVFQTLQPRDIYPLTRDPDSLTKEGFDILNEVLMKNILVDISSKFLTPDEQLLKVANFTKNEQIRIYKAFWLHTFPNRMMNRIQFAKFVVNLGWKKEECPQLFLSADTACVSGLTFKDFLLFLAATEPETPHGSQYSGEKRCEFIFRYYDKDRDNYLDQIELRTLITDIVSAKGKSKPSEIERLVSLYMVELGLGLAQKLSMNTFIKIIGELKLRGTSALFRSKTSVLKYVSEVCANKEYQSISPPSSKKKSTLMFGWETLSVLAPKLETVKDYMKITDKTTTFEIATHAVRLTRRGLLEDAKPIDRVLYAKSASLEGEEHFLRLPSLQDYDEKLPANKVLLELCNFTNEILLTKKGTFSKRAYSWDKCDMHQFMVNLMNVCEKCITILEKEPRMLQITSPVYILGDIHGNYKDLMVFEEVLWRLGLSITPCSLLFLGDYVDRGSFGVEVIAYLFAHKVKNPYKIFLLRGNHEIRSIQQKFTFYQECQNKFGEVYSHEVWNKINDVFDVMPLAAVVDNKVFCCHGGIPPPWLCARIEIINSIPCPLVIPEEESVLAWLIMWNDPVKSDQVTAAVAREMNANEGFASNKSRKTAQVFSMEALDDFLRKNNLSHVIRAHEVKQAGFQVQKGGKLLTVFSSSAYGGGPNEAACVLIFQGKIRVFRINAS